MDMKSNIIEAVKMIFDIIKMYVEAFVKAYIVITAIIIGVAVLIFFAVCTVMFFVG